MPRPRYHTAVSLGLAGLVVWRSHRWRDAIPVLIAGVLVDIDHLTDLFANRRAGRLAWVILPLHAWEWVLTLLARGSHGFAAGLAAHLALDQLNTAITHPLFYWITFRALNRFRAREPLINPQRYARGAQWMFQHPREWL
ncbi:MAG: hypothetical protein JO020_27885 [Chloroflexi bacterium]|nr:hypothetical protein [Chloroflexota bacterium]MBV9897993.1 hypothetical protein [Chloroflexota bacterium]